MLLALQLVSLEKSLAVVMVVMVVDRIGRVPVETDLGAVEISLIAAVQDFAVAMLDECALEIGFVGFGLRLVLVVLGF